MSRLVRSLIATALLSTGVAQAALVTFRIDSLTLNQVTAVEVNTRTGDDRGGIAMSGGNVLLNGDGRLASFNKNSLVYAGDAGRVMDGVFTDISTGKAYTFGTSASTPYTYGGTTNITHLIELNALGQPTSNNVALGTAFQISTSSSQNGVYAGWGSVIVRDVSGQTRKVSIDTGSVTNLGSTSATNAMGAENWAHWGVAEYFGGEDYITYAQAWTGNSTNILRKRVSDGATSTVASLTLLSDLANFTVDPTTNRWYFHYEGNGAAGSRDETLAFANATFTVQTTDNKLPEPGSLALVSVALLGLGLRARQQKQR
ncbi:PEP-CTERM sorting domain-containing protein [Pelomonas sp. UHG3]|uniref:PEP-CTERM sorting domain-containing protein n=1 Tax=Roseateles hydrophilus TaxID=2975054 RepID=A0ACC6CG00_9BURK|nr:PEP-CTERM sorting domain-containing protein [Pelomonas sp. UHG3]MCY4747358.1 PEP-CTERM sorting domain-containing protein [Pelomonas sp. UHG3]